MGLAAPDLIHFFPDMVQNNASEVTSLEAQISELSHGDHVCMIYESREEQIAGAVPFIRDGLERNERCVYIADDSTIQDARAALTAVGIDVEKETARGALSLMTKRDSYLRSGDFDPVGMVSFLEQTVERALADGFAGFRVTGEMTWALGCEHGCERLIEYEARLNNFFPRSRALAICQYNRKRFSPHVIYNILRTHPRAVIGRNVCSNLYYEPPEAVLKDQSIAEKVDWMLQQLRKAREIELQIARFNATLEAKVAEKTSSLEEAREQLQTFCYTMAHDLRSPLRTIESYAEMVVQDHGAQLDTDGRSYLERIRKAATRLQSLVGDLLSYAQVLRSDVGLEPIEARPFLELAVLEFKQSAAGRNAELEMRCKPGWVTGHRATLNGVVLNLLSNAAKFVAEGKRPRIIVATEESGDFLRISVADNGVGVPLEAQDRLFRPFERLHPRHAFEGSGMGLAIVKKSVERMGGRVGVESVPERGSRFWFELPRADPAVGA